VLNGAPFPASATAEGAQFNVPPFPATASAEGRLIKGGPPPTHTTLPQLFLSTCRYSVPGEGKYANPSYYRPEESAVAALLGH